MINENKGIYLNGEFVYIGYSISSAMAMAKHGIIDSVLHMNEIEAKQLNRIECYFMIAAGLWHHDPSITVNDISVLMKDVPLKKMQKAIKAALDILKYPTGITSLSE